VREVSISIEPGRVTALRGPSGSGKTTLLKCLGAVIEPTAGRMMLGGQTIYDGEWKIDDLRTLRRDRIGFVFQAPYLIPFLDVTDNVALLPMLAGVSNNDSRIRAQELLDVRTRIGNATVWQYAGDRSGTLASDLGGLSRQLYELAAEAAGKLGQ